VYVFRQTSSKYFEVDVEVDSCPGYLYPHAKINVIHNMRMKMPRRLVGI
jgi:hypothetical protein